jgi:type IV pilus assembly protein PilF
MLRTFARLALVIACAALVACAHPPVSPESSANSVQTGTVTGDVGEPRNRARIHTDLASAYFERGSVGVALEELRIAVEADPTYASAYSLLGLVHMELRENGVAQQHFERALRLAPNDPDINNNYGWFLCQTERPQQSIAYFLAALKNPLYVTPARSYVNAGLCSMKLNNDADAVGYFERALRSAPDDTQALLSLASIQYRRGQLEAARGHIVRLNRLVEPNAEALWLALRIERKLGDKAAETNYATQLRRRFSGSPEYQDLIKGKFE